MAYNQAIAHETLRVAVVDNVERAGCMPAGLREALLCTFSAQREIYHAICDRFRHLDGSQLNDTLQGENKGTFAFASIARRIEELQVLVEAGGLT